MIEVHYQYETVGWPSPTNNVLLREARKERTIKPMTRLGDSVYIGGGWCAGIGVRSLKLKCWIYGRCTIGLGRMPTQEEAEAAREFLTNRYPECFGYGLGVEDLQMDA